MELVDYQERMSELNYITQYNINNNNKGMISQKKGIYGEIKNLYVLP